MKKFYLNSVLIFFFLSLFTVGCEKNTSTVPILTAEVLAQDKSFIEELV
jgi:hypothetical protein